ncbi:Response regulator receiver domain-containing protein [Cohaesibacter sp. ES.047]|uniref:response regulator n=1 Tax=Cohaesibacter sp. ES.047 TaxID=1798205 RepID=UPI000BB7148C|nr:response regulator [Cohaesibacter sp. ES.047]SNY93590.1 Response regulator receiver domain-containing protein [Cohaesibacter sp. ES.047]
MPMQTILIVDDDESDQFICQYTIRKFDASIKTISAYDGQEALGILRETTPDAIILDINMPIMNGFEFLARYEADFDHHVPVVAMLTSSVLGKDQEQAMQYDFVRTFFEKPLTMDHLQKMKELLA